ncbi:MAG: bifunctional demethylmenaquinone methyltransferase/2-methoxy-6-polyprenyl-1,4-benzoquinol methylase UbiE [Muribaculaceae bacterium]|nr:bifunctional demethylmenaquinone methyltransferase/2-methoxy-6-polyprenyl-1,4-benzoquinol methylase UbiE [Muribaculaceae bacterium]
MFDNIAPAYDFMNRAMSFGIDKLWRKKAVSIIKRHGGKNMLDVATGTGDLAINMGKSMPDARITGIDLSEKMIGCGLAKIRSAKLDDRIQLMQADCLDLPFDDDSFDVITVAYGVRNFEKLQQGYNEMARVMKPGGMLVVIELSTPTSRWVLPFYKLYTRHIIPMVGRIVSKDVRAYTYLPESIAAVPQGHAMLSLMEKAGFKQTRHLPLTFGTCTIYIGIK